MTKIKCPTCGETTNWKDNLYRPFCSERCKSNDLGKWANEEYRIAKIEDDGGLSDEEIESAIADMQNPKKLH